MYFSFIKILTIGLCNSAVNSVLEKFSVLILLPEVFLSQIYRPLNFFILSLFLVNAPQALYINPGCLKRISGIHLSRANENLRTISFIFYLVLK